jgi:hypothetical protein
VTAIGSARPYRSADWIRRVLAVLLLTAWAARPAAAQVLPPVVIPDEEPPAAQAPAPARTGAPGFEFGLSGLLGGPVSFGTSSAGQLQPDGSRLTLFETSNRQLWEVGALVHVGVRAGRRLGFEGAGGFSRARLETRIRDDFEGASDLTLGETFYRMSVEGGLVWQFAGNDRAGWFVRGTGGWMRELIGDRVLGEHGAIANVGVGVKYWGPGRAPGRLRYGVRVEGHLAARWKGTTLDAKQIHVAPVVTAGLIIGS